MYSIRKKGGTQVFDLGEEDYVIGTVGRLAIAKNQKLFLTAAQQAIEQGLKAVFLIAGTGPEETALRQLAATLKIEKKIRFLGQVHDRILLYRTLDLFALTSLYEGLPIVLLEAMASGIPVISTDLEGVRYVLEGGRYGTLVGSNNIAELTSAFLRSPSQAQVESARSKIERDFSAINAVEAVSKIYKKWLNKN